MFGRCPPARIRTMSARHADAERQGGFPPEQENTMRSVAIGCTALLALTIGGCSGDPVGRDPALASAATQTASLSRGRGEGDGGSEVLILDDCDPNDPTWAPTGGCLLRDGRVTNAEFTALLRSPLSLSTVGHPAWRNQPSYLDLESGKSVKATNAGGR